MSFRRKPFGRLTFCRQWCLFIQYKLVDRHLIDNNVFLSNANWSTDINWHLVDSNVFSSKAIWSTDIWSTIKRDLSSSGLCLPNILSAKCLSGKCLLAKCLLARCLSAKCLSGKCLSTKRNGTGKGCESSALNVGQFNKSFYKFKNLDFELVKMSVCEKVAEPNETGKTGQYGWYLQFYKFTNLDFKLVNFFGFEKVAKPSETG